MDVRIPIVAIALTGTITCLSAADGPASRPTTAAAATAATATQPDVAECATLLGKPIDSVEVKAFVAKYALREGHRFQSGSLWPETGGFRLMFRDDSISTLILSVAPNQYDRDKPHFVAFAHPLPGGLVASDHDRDVRAKLGRPTKPDGDRWVDGPLLIWVVWTKHGGTIEDLFISSAEAKP